MSLQRFDLLISGIYIRQEEVGELKAELRKVVSEAKNTVRRLSAGRTGAAASGGAFGFTPRGGGGGHVENMLPGKGPPHTPSKKLSEAKSRCVSSCGIPLH